MTTRTLATVLLAAALAGCAADFAPVAIYELCAPPEPDTATGGCLYPATCDAALAGTPKLDVQTALADFRLPVQLNNSLANNASADDGRINTNDAFIRSFEITYTGAAVNPVTIDVAVTVPAAGSAGALLPLIPQAYFAALTPPPNTTTSILVNVRGHGKLTSQDSFTTAWFQVPVSICAGCLAGDVCPGGLMVSCPGSPLGATSPGQTAAVSCIAP